MRAAEIKVVVVTMFEPGGGRPGELSHFRAGLELEPWDVPGFAAGALWRNGAGVAALVTGVGPVNTALQVQALGLAPEADCRRAWWLVCGVAGGNPSVCSLGSPVWADWVVDGDLAYDFHPADIPPDWETGIVPLGARWPFDRSGVDSSLFGGRYEVFQLDPGLAAWAQATTQNLILEDPPGLAAARAPFANYGPGGATPAVTRGACLSAARFWHGARHHAWAERWVEFWTAGRGRLATTSMEDSGTLAALHRLALQGQADARRALVLRSVSNYTLSPPGVSAPEYLTGGADSGEGADFPGLAAALENGWRAGRTVIAAWLRSWPAEPSGLQR